MTRNQLLEVLKAKRMPIAVILVLILTNMGIVIYSQLVQEPKLVKLQDEWTEKRRLVTGGGGDLAAIYRQGTADLAAFQERIPLKRDFTRQMMEVFEIAANNGLKVKGITYKPEAQKEANLVVYGVTMSLDGQYAGIKSFISDLQCHGGLLTIDSISLSNTSMTEEAVSLKMQLSAYLRPEGK
ncbi:type 4a pilus biogenesis protein PilO [Geobacter hydrogenophilus]|uniref:Pilus assembly protein PilO n=1 Tax=Geobacter hydrogenophilus TaxID=40983 RepID=A0A9W6G226_9BACT|nr:type 4a pilus biogenesis protein PilO [Geobacter hydrogenophilus]MBT0893164.1 type 4a pilus biogenesis protein PilO [Geobacter hydrogenophilus]GLI38992.1 pilus assembly protein PilO [Geobacter hydrogenophilus]